VTGMDITLLHSIWTVLALVAFVGIVIWAWSGKRKPGFEQAARMALDDDLPVPPVGNKEKEYEHG